MPEDAELLILNTCGFIQPAVEEAISEIFELVRIKEHSPEKKIVVVGCLVQRYKEKLSEDLPEIDLFLGTEGAVDIAEYVDSIGKMANAEPCFACRTNTLCPAILPALSQHLNFGHG